MNAPITAYDLRADDRRAPLALGSAAPVLAWRMRSSTRDAEPSAVLIEAASSRDALERGEADLWSTGPLPFTVPRLRWAGAELVSRSEVHWRVALLTADVSTVVWSAPSSFEVALLDSREWEAEWITHPDWVTGEGSALPVLGEDFVVPTDVRRARLYASGAGVFSIDLNDSPASPDVLSPGYSTWDVRVGATAWDVTALLRPGANTIRVHLGTGIAWVPPLEGRYTKLSTLALAPRALIRLEMVLADGSTAVVRSGRTWKATTGSVIASHWYGGEDQDLRLADGNGAIDGAWVPASVLGAASAHEPWWSEHPPLRVTERIPAAEVVRLGDGTRIVDFGVNVAGWPVLDLGPGRAGDEVTVWPAEMLDQGRADQHSIGMPTWDSVITPEGAVQWHPRFVYHGFRYLEVRGLAERDAEFEAWVIRASNDSAGGLASSDPFITTLHTIIDRAVQGNMYSVFTDCPNREKLGWVEQLNLCFEAVARNYDVNAHLRDALCHIRDAQLADGSVTSIAPETVSFAGIELGGDPDPFRSDVNWGGVIAFLPWRLYENYGDPTVLEENWNAIVRYGDYLDSRADAGILDFGLGDWIAIDTSTPRALVATFGYIRFTETAARIAKVLGRHADHDRFARIAEAARKAVSERFLNADGTWGSGSQASYALALDLGIADDYAFERLLDAIEANAGCVSVGENSWPSLLAVLHARGRDDVIDRMVRTVDGPGYGWQIMHGATALAESWQGAAGAKFENSQNHFMLGMVHDWLHADIAGLAQAAGSIGWRRMRVRPTPVGSVGSMSTEYETPYGRAAVSWIRSEAGFELEVVVPPGSSAVVEVPLLDGRDAVSLDGASRVTAESAGYDRFEIASGEWRFAS